MYSSYATDSREFTDLKMVILGGCVALTASSAMLGCYKIFCRRRQAASDKSLTDPETGIAGKATSAGLAQPNQNFAVAVLSAFVDRSWYPKIETSDALEASLTRKARPELS